MFSYYAPNPYPKKSTGWFSSFFSSSASSSASIGGMVLPAQWRQPQALNEDDLEQLAYKKSLQITGGYIATHDDATLDTIELSPNNEVTKEANRRKFIIKFNGNGGQYEDLVREYAYDANRLQQTVIGFNYRGVGNSQRKPEIFQNLVTDGIAQVQRLLDMGADPKNILLDGHSLGGSVATMVAFHFHQLNKRVYLWNDRSFSSLSRAAAGVIAPDLTGSLDDTVQSSLASTSWSVMTPSGWDVDVAAAYKAIPAQYKSYMVLGKPSDHCAGDQVISHQASLAVKVKKEEKAKGTPTGHKVYSMFAGHNLPRHALLTKDGSKTGQDLFERFATNSLGA